METVQSITHEKALPHGNEKILGLEDLVQKVKELKEQGKEIGYIEGVWDIYHEGHVDFIEFARSKCDVLVVAVASDEYVQVNKGNPQKGDTRPIFGQQERCRVIAKNEDVGLVLREKNPAAKFGSEEYEDYMRYITQEIKPDKMIVNSQTDISVETKKARSAAIGAQFIICDLKPPTSTSAVAQKLLELDKDQS